MRSKRIRYFPQILQTFIPSSKAYCPAVKFMVPYMKGSGGIETVARWRVALLEQGSDVIQLPSAKTAESLILSGKLHKESTIQIYSSAGIPKSHKAGNLAQFDAIFRRIEEEWRRESPSPGADGPLDSRSTLPKMEEFDPEHSSNTESFSQPEQAGEPAPDRAREDEAEPQPASDAEELREKKPTGRHAWAWAFYIAAGVLAILLFAPWPKTSVDERWTVRAADTYSDQSASGKSVRIARGAHLTVVSVNREWARIATAGDVEKRFIRLVDLSDSQPPALDGSSYVGWHEALKDGYIRPDPDDDAAPIAAITPHSDHGGVTVVGRLADLHGGAQWLEVVLRDSRIGYVHADLVEGGARKRPPAPQPPAIRTQVVVAPPPAATGRCSGLGGLEGAFCRYPQLASLDQEMVRAYDAAYRLNPIEAGLSPQQWRAQVPCRPQSYICYSNAYTARIAALGQVRAPPPPAPTPSPTPIPTRPVPKNRASWITNDDYPTRELEAGVGGRVSFHLDVDNDGRAHCRVTGWDPTVSEALKQSTCALIQRRARFQKNSPGSYDDSVRWQPPKE